MDSLIKRLNQEKVFLSSEAIHILQNQNIDLNILSLLNEYDLVSMALDAEDRNKLVQFLNKIKLKYKRLLEELEVSNDENFHEKVIVSIQNNSLSHLVDEFTEEQYLKLMEQLKKDGMYKENTKNKILEIFKKYKISTKIQDEFAQELISNGFDHAWNKYQSKILQKYLNEIKIELEALLDIDRSKILSKDDLLKIEIFKLLKSNDTTTDDKCIDSEFSRIRLKQLNVKLLKKILINKEEFIHELKPYVFDSLKRFDRLHSVKCCLLEFSNSKSENEKFSYLNKIEDRDIICSVIKSLNTQSKAKFGSLLANNDYPIPLMFTSYVENENGFGYSIEFDTLKDVIGFTDKSLIVISGTTNTVFMGKSSLAPILFSSLHEEKSIFKSKFNFKTRKNNVDLICNEETCGSEFIIADFHSEVQTIEAKNLLKSFLAYSSLHIINAAVNDSDEIDEIMNFYETLLKRSATILILVRDYENTSQKAKLENMKSKYTGKDHIKVLTVENLSSNDDSIPYVKKHLNEALNEIISKLNKISIHSIIDIQRFYEQLTTNKAYNLNESLQFPIELEFQQLFHNYDKNMFEEIFPIAHMKKKIAELEESLSKIGYNNPNRETVDIELNITKKQLLEINPFSSHVNFFVKMLTSGETIFLSDVIILENYLIKIKKDQLSKLRMLRIRQQNEIEKQMKKIKRFELQNEHMDRNTDESLALLKAEKMNLESILKNIDDQIDVFDLTIDKFFDEIFSTYDWILLKEAQQSHLIDESLRASIDEFKSKFETLLDRYMQLIEYGFPIHVLRGRPLKIKSKAIEMVFNKLKSDQELFVITVIGEQSSAKSSLMNSLFGCNFRTSAGRCTVGIYMNFVNYNDKKIVILDTEGLMSVESGNVVFDNQLATMAVLSSHMIIINHKGEISSNLERLLGITFYAKLQTCTSVFKPSVLFVLRDQCDRQQSSIATQAAKLKSKLIQQTSKIKESIDDVMFIETEDIVLLPNAFAEDKSCLNEKEVKWRNNLFPEEILKLRRNLIHKLTSMNKNGHIFNSLSGLYTSMCSYWKTLEDLGHGILNCKDLEEIKMRNEIATKCSVLISQYDAEFTKKCQNILSKTQNDFKNVYSEDVFDAGVNDLNECCKQMLFETLKQFEKITNLSYFPEDIKIEYISRIQQYFERIKSYCLINLKNHASHVKEITQLEKLKREMIQYASNLLKIENNLNEETFMEKLNDKMNEFNTKHENYLVSLYKNDTDIANKIQDCFNRNHNQFIYDAKFENLQSMPKLNNVENILFDFKVDNSKWYNWKSTLQFFECTDWIEDQLCTRIIPKVIENIKTPYVEDTQIIYAMQLINEILFCIHSPIVMNKYCFKINNLMHDILITVFHEMYNTYFKLQNDLLRKCREDFDKMKNQLKTDIIEYVSKMSDSKKTAENIAIQLMQKIDSSILEETEIDINNKVQFEILNKLKNPEEIIEHAFNTSFCSSDYKAVFKYVVDVSKYCLEVSQRLTEHKIKAIIESEINEHGKKLLEFTKIINNLIFDTKTTSTHQFIDSISKKIQNDHIIKRLTRAKLLIIDVEICDFDQFIESFTKTISKETVRSLDKLPYHTNYFQDYAQFYYKSELTRFIGCASTCPGCGSKCHLEIGHSGSHRSHKHILNGFNGWHYEKTKIICTEFCWSKEFFLYPVYRGHGKDKKLFPSFEIYLKTLYPEWLSDIKDNYVKYYGGQLNSNKFLDFDYFMKKAWMNVRNPILKRRSSRRNKILDKECYDEEWLKFEDKQKMLEKSFKIDGY